MNIWRLLTGCCPSDRGRALDEFCPRTDRTGPIDLMPQRVATQNENQNFRYCPLTLARINP
ncbi:hypothetical protein, partial [Schlesneria sp.]|uniref:hypothetical protein n=1 Tax=Schlesneria sp. TaxID=2762018 RepID=UPI002F21FC4A